MPALYFQDRFVPDVESGKKRQTIRKVRTRNPIKAGDQLILRNKARQPGGRVLRLVLCTRVSPIQIGPQSVMLNGRNLSSQQEWALAKDDGFGTVIEMWRWFRRCYGLPFKGVLIEW